MERAAVVDPHDHLRAGAQVGHPRIGRDRQGRMRCRHLVHVVALARRCLLAMELLAVPAARAALLQRLGVGQRHIRLAEDDIRLVTTRGVGFDLRLGIRHGLQMRRWRVARAVVEIIAAATGAGGRQDRHARRRRGGAGRRRADAAWRRRNRRAHRSATGKQEAEDEAEKEPGDGAENRSGTGPVAALQAIAVLATFHRRSPCIDSGSENQVSSGPACDGAGCSSGCRCPGRA